MSGPRTFSVITQQSGRLQKLYRTSTPARESRAGRTVSFADRVSHPVDPPRAFLHVLRAGGSAQNGQSPEHSESAAHAVNQN